MRRNPLNDKGKVEFRLNIKGLRVNKCRRFICPKKLMQGGMKSIKLKNDIMRIKFCAMAQFYM